MVKRYLNAELYGKVFRAKKRAEEYRKKQAEEILEAKKKGVPINLRFRVLKMGSKYVVTKESKKR